ncbi:MAG: arylsulfatase [Candidatus Aminicenantes bacterium]|nr:arylsulfatase [Candidatus Aminicenantes bacterium]
MERRDFLKTLGLSASGLAFPLDGALSRKTPPPEKGPNIVLILGDDVGQGDLTCYNKDSKIPTPRMDRVAAGGVRFTDAHSPSALCSPTRYGLLTGRYAWRTRLQKFVLLSYDPPLIEPTRMTVASLLKKSGYATAWVGKWHVGLEWATKDGSPAENAIDRAAPGKTDEKLQEVIDFTQPIRGGPTSLGFDYFYGTSACCTSDPPYCFIENDRTVVVPTRMSREEWRGLPGFVPGPMADDWSETDCDFTLTRKAIDFIDGHLEKHPQKPFFLVLSTSSPHNPFLVPEAMKGKSQAGPRGDLVTVVDWAVGQVDDHLAKRGLASETLLIVASDNGAVRGENGHKSENDFRGFKASVYEGGTRIPFIARWPGRIRPGTTSSETISLIDLCATCAALTGTALPDDAAEDSRDVLPAILGRSDGRPLDEARIFDSGNGVFAVRQGRWKVIVGTLDDLTAIRTSAKAGELYDLDEDPGERNDVWAQHPDLAKSMIERLVKYRAEGRSRPAKNARR